MKRGAQEGWIRACSWGGGTAAPTALQGVGERGCHALERGRDSVLSGGVGAGGCGSGQIAALTRRPGLTAPFPGQLDEGSRGFPDSVRACVGARGVRERTPISRSHGQ